MNSPILLDACLPRKQKTRMSGAVCTVTGKAQTNACFVKCKGSWRKLSAEIGHRDISGWPSQLPVFVLILPREQWNLNVPIWQMKTQMQEAVSPICHRPSPLGPSSVMERALDPTFLCHKKSTKYRRHKFHFTGEKAKAQRGWDQNPCLWLFLRVPKTNSLKAWISTGKKTFFCLRL